MINRIAILQPSYIPWLGYFDQINRVNTFIFYNDVLYTKNDWRNRNRIKTPHGSMWLTIPVRIKHRNMIEANYKKAPFFREFCDAIAPEFNRKHTGLSELNINITMLISQFLGIHKVRFLKSSDLGIFHENHTERLIALCRYINATHYLTGQSAKSYLDEDLFTKNGIILEYQVYKHPVYKQLWGDFIPFLSIIDLVFNEGHNSLRILSQKK